MTCTTYEQYNTVVTLICTLQYSYIYCTTVLAYRTYIVECFSTLNSVPTVEYSSCTLYSVPVLYLLYVLAYCSVHTRTKYCILYSSGSQTFFGKCHQMWHSKGVKCQLNIFQVLNSVVNFLNLNLFDKFILHNVYARGVNSTEISGPARKFVLFGPARILIYCITKFVQWFNYFLWGEGGRTKTHKNFVKYGYNLKFNQCTIADLWDPQNKILFLEYQATLKNILKIINKFLKICNFLNKFNRTIINYKNLIALILFILYKCIKQRCQPGRAGLGPNCLIGPARPGRTIS